MKRSRKERDIVYFAETSYVLPEKKKPIKLLPHQKEILRLCFTRDKQGIFPYDTIVYSTIKKSGKALSIDTPLPTPTGWTKMGDISIGDSLFDERGKECRVIYATEKMLGHECYKVVFSDGSNIVADAEHIWAVEALEYKYNQIPLSTEQLKSRLQIRTDGAHNYRIKISSPLILPEVNLPINPYVLGVWLGDGNSRGARITASDSEIRRLIRVEGAHLRRYKTVSYQDKAPEYLLHNGIHRTKDAKGSYCHNGSIHSLLRNLNLFNNKHIPQIYLRASYRQRLALLQGLMDTDGYISKARGTSGCECEFSTKFELLAKTFRELLTTLGIKSTIRRDLSKLYGRIVGYRYRIKFHSPVDVPVFRLKRKLSRQRPSTNRTLRSTNRHIVSISEVESVPVRCIQVDSPSHLYLTGESMIPTHNTEIGALIGLWFAASECPFNEVYFIANDLEQAQSRGYKRICQIIDSSKEIGLPLGKLNHQRSVIKFPDGTEIQAISSDYAGAAGANQGLVVFDELWAVVSENGRRLYDEMTPVPTRLNSLRVIVTYAGFEGESSLLWELYQLGRAGHRLFTDEELEQRYPDMEELYRDALRYIWVNEEAKLFMHWDNKARMPWQTPAYYAAQRKTLRPNQYKRLHQNEWVQSMTSGFIPMEDWDKCIVPELSPAMPGLKQPLFVGVDIATKRDTCAVVGVYWDTDKKKIMLANHRIWQPTPNNPLDFESTVEQFILDLYSKFAIANVYYDPSQFVRSAQFLTGKGIPLTEYLQVPTNLTSMTQILYELARGRNILMYPSPELRRQNMDCSIMESARGMRIAKEKASQKIDAIVALAMACQAAWDGCGLTPLPDSQPEAHTKWGFQSLAPSVVDLDEGTVRSRSRWRI